MDEKISQEAIARYADRYADEVVKGFFSTQEKITGPEVLSLCKVHQVNLFVVRELFRDWKTQTEQQKSPYFDYDHHEVGEALRAYMTVLSNHIAIDREHFIPLLKAAVRQTLMLIFNPYDFYSSLISGKSDTLDVASFREEIKYLKINRAPLERMLGKLGEKNVQTIAGNEAFAVLDQILEEVNFTPEDLEGYIAAFSVLVPLSVDEFYTQRADTTVERPVPVVEERRPKERRVEEERLTLNDRLNAGKQPMVADNFRKISSIRENLTINQKFMFTKVLFYGDFESFSRVVEDIDKMSSFEEALGYLETQSSNWDRESREFHEFMEMLEKRFA